MPLQALSWAHYWVMMPFQSTEESIAEDIAAGAPQNEDGTINLIEYAAWLVKGDDTDAPDSN